jgi:hypothetical protein
MAARPVLGQNLDMDPGALDRSPSPAPWAFEERFYGISHVLLDRDGRVIGSHLPLGNGPLLAEAPAMAALLRALVDGGSANALRAEAAAILARIDRQRPRQPGDDDA